MPKENFEEKAKPDKPEAKAPVEDGLVEMKKGAEKLRVHPSCVEDHQDNGWS